MARLLLTSFRPWKLYQQDNSSDQLVAQLWNQALLPPDTVVLRRLPVHTQLAPMIVMARVFELHPQVVVCCGMAENRDHLSLEQQGIEGDRVVKSPLDLQALIAGTTMTAISADAGNYVCNHLYYQLLTCFQRDRWPIQALFIHVPPLTPNNTLALTEDCRWILAKLHKLPQGNRS